MTELVDTLGLDQAGRAAIATALDRLGAQGATCQAHFRTRGRNVCFNAVSAPSESWSDYSAAAARRAAAQGRRLLPVLGSGELGGRFWIAYEMGSAVSLSDHRRHVVLPTESCLRLFSDVARALEDAAAAGVFPYELPPESVFVSRRCAHLGDFGTAREALGRSRSGVDYPPYVPPEVLRGGAPGERSGTFVFGALLYHLLAGASPRHGGYVPLASWRPDLPPAMDSIVAAAMADQPGRRPRSASEAHDLAKRAIREASTPAGDSRPPSAWPELGSPGRKPARRSAPGPESPSAPQSPAVRGSAAAPQRPAAPQRRSAPGSAAAPGRAAAPAPRNGDPPARTTRIRWSDLASRIAKPPARTPSSATTKRQSAKPAAAKPAGAKPAAPQPATRGPVSAASKPAAPGPTSAGPIRRATVAHPSVAPPPPSPARGRPSASMPRPHLSLPAVAIAGSLVLGAFMGLALGGSSDPEPAGAKVVDAGGLGVTMPPGWHAAHAAGSLSVQAEGASGASLQARLVDRPPVLQPGLEPVQLGTLQAWRASAPGMVRYAAPTTRGTVLITCQASPAADSSSLRECERTASTLTLRTGAPLPVTDAIEQEDRLRATIADLRAERESGRERLAEAGQPRDQSATARVLALTHERAAAALDRVSGAEHIESAVRGAAAAYSDLAASAKSGSTERWNGARDRLRRSDASVAEALATGS